MPLRCSLGWRPLWPPFWNLLLILHGHGPFPCLYLFPYPCLYHGPCWVVHSRQVSQYA